MGQQMNRAIHVRSQPGAMGYAAQIDDVAPVNYTFMFRHAPVGMILSHNRVIHECNDAVVRMFGHEREALLGQTFCLLYPSADEYEHFGVAIAPFLRATGRYVDERIMRRASGELFWCRVTGSATQRDDPHAEAIWVFEDLSEKRGVGVNLTAREREISAMLIDGNSCKLIARRIGLSPRTVEMHKSRLMRKYSSANSIELVKRLRE